MAKFHEEWIVDPHGPIERVATGLFTVAGEIMMPLGRFPRRMTIAALRRGRLAIWSAIPLRDDAMLALEALGTPAFLIVPGTGHRLDVKAWKHRYPEARVVCPPGARKAVEEVLPVDAVTDILDDPDVRLETVAGVGEREAALLVRRDGQLTLVVNDILANVRHPHGLGAHVMARLLGFGVTRPRMPRIGKRMFVKDTAALASEFRRWAREPELARIIASHGDIIDAAPAAALERAAQDLD